MASFARLLNDTITLASVASRDTAGDPTYGTQTTFKARWEKESRVVAGPDGTEYRVDDVLYCATEVATGSRVWLPGANTSNGHEARKVVSAEKVVSPDGSTTLWVLGVK